MQLVDLQSQLFWAGVCGVLLVMGLIAARRRSRAVRRLRAALDVYADREIAANQLSMRRSGVLLHGTATD